MCVYYICIQWKCDNMVLVANKLSGHRCFVFIPVEYSIKPPFILYMSVCESG